MNTTPTLLISLLLLILLSGLSFAQAKQFSVEVSIFNQTGKLQQLSGLQHGFYDDLIVTPANNTQLSHSITEPLVVNITPQEPGKLFRFKYHFAGSKGCLLDFILTWHSQDKEYELRNLHVSNGEKHICPTSAIKVDKQQNQARFSLAVIAI